MRSIAVLMLLTVTGCATIVGGGTSQLVAVRAEPAAVQFTIRAGNGLQMASGTAPQQVTLPRKNQYEIEFTAAGYQPQKLALTQGVNGWVWGNFIFGWIIGFAVDFINGSAYKLQPAIVDVRMVQGSAPALDVRLLTEDGTLIQQRILPLVRE